MRRLIIIAAVAAASPVLAQTPGRVPQPQDHGPMWCDVSLKSDTGDRVWVTTGPASAGVNKPWFQAYWFPAVPDPLSLFVRYESQTAVTASPATEAIFEFKVAEKPAAPFTAVLRQAGRSWSLELDPFDLHLPGPPDVRVRARLDPATPQGHEILEALATGAPMAVSIERDGAV